MGVISRCIGHNWHPAVEGCSRCSRVTTAVGASEDDYRFFRFYLLDRQAKGTYLTGHLNRKLISKYNKKEFIPYFEDKGLFAKTFGGFWEEIGLPSKT